jgi:CBS domain-containing protein
MSSELTAQELMQSEVRSVSSAMPVIELEHLLIRDGLGGVAVIDDDKLVGIISRSDILRYLSDEDGPDSEDADYYWDFGVAAGVDPAASHRSSAQAKLVEKMLSELSVADLMVRDVISVSPSTGVSEVACLMEGKHIHRVLVVEGDTLCGVITTMDMTRLLADGRAVAKSG